MTVTSQIDLRGISWPVCLLNFKQNLLALHEGECLEILLGDPEVADQIQMIVERSEDKIIDRQREGERLRLRIEKGKGPDSEKMISGGVLRVSK
jgi:TusA-related sulfurtransferase